jgi:hypothetical protein
MTLLDYNLRKGPSAAASDKSLSLVTSHKIYTLVNKLAFRNHQSYYYQLSNPHRYDKRKF